jgi:Leucine Rich repeat
MSERPIKGRDLKRAKPFSVISLIRLPESALWDSRANRISRLLSICTNRTMISCSTMIRLSLSSNCLMRWTFVTIIIGLVVTSFLFPQYSRFMLMRRIEELGGTIETIPGELPLLRMILTEQQIKIFEPVIFIDVSGTAFTDTDLSLLGSQSSLETLFASDTKITDRGMQHLRDMSSVKELDIRGTRVSDDGICFLSGMINLRVLQLSGTDVTDSGLETIRGFSKLEILSLKGLSVSDAGISRLTQCTHLKGLMLSDTAISDSAACHLSEFMELEDVWLLRTEMSDECISYLSLMKCLRKLYLGGTRVSENGILELKEALSGVKVFR